MATRVLTRMTTTMTTTMTMTRSKVKTGGARTTQRAWPVQIVQLHEPPQQLLGFACSGGGSIGGGKNGVGGYGDGGGGGGKIFGAVRRGVFNLAMHHTFTAQHNIAFEPCPIRALEP